MKKMKALDDRKTRWIVGIAAALMLLAAALTFWLPGKPSDGYTLTLDGKSWQGGVLQRTQAAAEGRDEGENLRVIVTLNGQEIATLPFTEAHVLRVSLQGAERTRLP